VIVSALAVTLVAALGGAAIADRPPISDSDPHKGVARAHKMPVKGIDVSYWQGDIDWAQVRAAGVDFAYLKATEGGDHIDPKFQENWHAAKRAGLPRGAYHFIYWCRPAREQALWFMLNVPQDPEALPPVLDLEWNGHSPTCSKRIAAKTAREMIDTLLAAMEAHTGKRPIIYTDTVFHADVLEGHYKNYHFWLRSVAAEPKKIFRNRPWLMWQYTTTGRVRGIAGDVDLNTFEGNSRQWRRFLRQVQAAR
jgi:lysozyme